MSGELDQLKIRFEEEIAGVDSEIGLDALRIKYLARKGYLPQYFKKLSSLTPEDRPRIGQKLNKIKKSCEAAFASKQLEISRPQSADSPIDLTLSGIKPRLGCRHPLLRTLDDINKIFIKMGFRVESGPETENEYYNFEALNFPPNHPSRDLQDTFYLSSPGSKAEEVLLLRTHTSTVQIRTMERSAPPIRIIAPGRVFRKDTPDATHSPVFHQIEGLWVDEGVTMADLKGTLISFVKLFFEQDLDIRFRPSYFPFTEPSAEVDVWFESRNSWLEMMGCGMVDPNVLEPLEIDPEKYTGFAFGMGIERLAMIKYGIDDIRVFYDNDVRFIRQF